MNLFPIMALAICLSACSPIQETVRPSVQHNRNLRRETTTALEKQECWDQTLACAQEMVYHHQDACNVEANYCYLPNWIEVVSHSCARKYMLCISR